MKIIRRALLAAGVALAPILKQTTVVPFDKITPSNSVDGERLFLG